MQDDRGTPQRAAKIKNWRAMLWKFRSRLEPAKGAFETMLEYRYSPDAIDA
jgi:hypothetical protein